MAEGNKIEALPATYGGLRVSTYFRVLPRDRVLNFTVYGEYERLNGAALYKMEVAGFGGEELAGSIVAARRTPARTFEQRAIVYHDWGRNNVTFNFISETGLSSPGNDFGYALGVFRQPSWTGMAGMPGMSIPAALSFQRLGYGLEMSGAFGRQSPIRFRLATRAAVPRPGVQLCPVAKLDRPLGACTRSQRRKRPVRTSSGHDVFD